MSISLLQSPLCLAKEIKPLFPSPLLSSLFLFGISAQMAKILASPSSSYSPKKGVSSLSAPNLPKLFSYSRLPTAGPVAMSLVQATVILDLSGGFLVLSVVASKLVSQLPLILQCSHCNQVILVFIFGCAGFSLLYGLCSSCEQGLLCGHRAWVSHCGGFSCGALGGFQLLRLQGL